MSAEAVNGAMWVEFLPRTRLAEQDAHWRASVLGAACFGSATELPDFDALPALAVDMPVLAGSSDLCEVWHCAEPLSSGKYGDIRYRQSETLLFGSLSRPAGADLRAQTRAAYEAIFELLDRLDYPAVLRFWNYFPAINQETGGMERYRQFNVGRQDAFLAHERAISGNVPAACALGSVSGALNIAFLALRGEVVGIENPRQLSAYHYPGEYGPRSPIFSRAGLARLGGRDVVFVSGTASIVGHQTLHRGDVVAQARESMTNIAAVIDAAAARSGTPLQLDTLCYKIYLRDPADLARVRQEIERFVAGSVQTVYLQADVCRADLLVEIEASGGHAVRFC